VTVERMSREGQPKQTVASRVFVGAGLIIQTVKLPITETLMVQQTNLNKVSLVNALPVLGISASFVRNIKTFDQLANGITFTAGL